MIPVFAGFRDFAILGLLCYVAVKITSLSTQLLPVRSFTVTWNDYENVN